MIKLEIINDDVIKPLMKSGVFLDGTASQAGCIIDELSDRLISSSSVKKVDTASGAIEACLTGSAVLFIEGCAEAAGIEAQGWEKRTITEPSNETVVRGPREGFTENLRTNTVMIRRRINNPLLKIITMKIGSRTRTQVSIMYMEGLTNPNIIREAERRLKKIDTDQALSAGYIEQYIGDGPYSMFPTIWASEKPDAVAGKLLEGRAAILVDGSPAVLTIPVLFIENFQTTEDYIVKSVYASFLRILRFTSFIISLFAPALYVALTAFHQELIPTTLLFTMAAASEGTPFPTALETAGMMLTFEIIKEGGVRMPRPIGQAISIVGALVMGQAAVQAGLVGAPVVIVIAITAVASFVTPLISEAVSILRWFLLLLAATMGIYGITLGTFAIIVHLVSLKSFNADYFAPFVPFKSSDLKDTAVRANLWKMKNRPESLHPQDMKRQGIDSPPANRDK